MPNEKEMMGTLPLGAGFSFVWARHTNGGEVWGSLLDGRHSVSSGWWRTADVEAAASLALGAHLAIKAAGKM